MEPIDRSGTYRGRLLEWVVNETKNGYPQFVARLQADELYDEDTETWQSWTEYEREITAYLVLYYVKNDEMVPSFQHENCQRALGWEGNSFASLSNGDWGNIAIQFRVEANNYPGGFPFKVQTIDAHDANPTRGLKKLDPKRLAALDADPRFKQAARKAPPKRVAPAAAPPKAPADPTPAAGADEPPATAAPSAGAELGSTPPAAPSKSKPGPRRPKPTSRKTPPKQGEMTKIEAWNKVHELKVDGTSDEDVNEAWYASIKEICPEKSDDDRTPTEWAAICDATVKQIGVPF